MSAALENVYRGGGGGGGGCGRYGVFDYIWKNVPFMGMNIIQSEFFPFPIGETGKIYI
jgi:hypothetical protein